MSEIPKRPQRLEKHGHVRVDHYFWLRERESPEVRAFLEAENAHTRAEMAPTERLQEQLYEEIVGRIHKDDSSVPYRRGGDFHYVRYAETSEYPIYCRRRRGLEAPEEVLFDANARATDHAYYDAAVEVSLDGRLLAYAEDTVGRRSYTIRIRDLESGRDLPDVMGDATGNMVFAADHRTLFFARRDPETLRSDRIYRRKVGSADATETLVFHEEDDTYACHVYRAKSQRYLFVHSGQTVSDEVHFVPADAPDAPLALVVPRERELEYAVDHVGDHFYICTNAGGARNFKLVRARPDDCGRASWSDVVPHRSDVLLEDVELFDDFFVCCERRAGLVRLRVVAFADGAERTIEFDEPAYFAWSGQNFEPGSRTYRYVYTSMTTPTSVYDYDLDTGERRLMKRERVLGDFDPERYRTERLLAPARDGARVPISLVYAASLDLSEPRPLLLYGYGSYGYSLDASFSSPRLSLLDRGMVFAIAHVRGGEEMGRAWYEQGRQRAKWNTFHDFIDCAEHLVERGLTAPDRLFASGGSAGGLLMGVVINERPDLFCGVVADVPFVDVVTTMLDDTIPLTSSEYDEWGDPNDPESFAYMLSYSPYDNVRAQVYPHLLVTTGLHDSQVQYWEPAKWVAKLRELSRGDRRLLLKTNLDAGHGGASGRFAHHRETAFAYAFLLDLAGLA